MEKNFLTAKLLKQVYRYHNLRKAVVSTAVPSIVYSVFIVAPFVCGGFVFGPCFEL